MRKEVIKRRLKTEILNKKKMDHDPGRMNNAKEFEESLNKLASMAKNRIKFSDFNSKDRFNILDLFVNNDKSLLHIYSALFPHKVNGERFKE